MPSPKRPLPSPKRRVLIVIKGLSEGGAEKLIAEGARHWSRERFDYRVAFVLPWKDGLVRDLEALDVPVDCIGSTRGLGPGALSRLRQLVSRYAVELLHVHSPAVASLARITAPRHVPIVYTEHNVAQSYRFATRTANRLTYRRNAAVIAVSNAVADSVSTYTGPTPVTIPNGVEVTINEAAGVAARDELSLGLDDPLVVHIGNIRPHKGHDVLLKVGELLYQRGTTVTIVSIGGEKHPNDLDRLRGRAAALGLGKSMRFLGRRADALDFLQAADIYVSPGDLEGLPVALLEAMGLGRPVVATNTGGVSGLVVDRKTGLLVDAGDPRSIAKAIETLLLNRGLAATLAAAGRELVESEYALKSMVQSVERVYETALDC